MAERKGRCTNIGNDCTNADTGKILAISEGAEFVCPDCGLPLMPVKGGNGRFPIPSKLVFLIAGLVLITGLMGLGVWKVMELRAAVKSGDVIVEQLSGLARWLAVKFVPIALTGSLSGEGNGLNKPVEDSKTSPNSSHGDSSPAKPVASLNLPDTSPPPTPVNGTTKAEMDQLKQDTERRLQELQRKAQEELQEAQEKSRKDLQRLDAKVNLQQGLNYARLKDYHNSVKEFSIAIQKDDGISEAYSNRAAAYMQLQMYSEALKDLKKAVALEPGDPVIHYNLSSLYAAQKEFDLALQSLDNALYNGFHDIATLRNDPDFKQLRTRPEYRKLLEKYGVSRR